MDIELNPDTADQIANLHIDATRPLLISDADEVLVHFARPLEAWLDEHGLYIDLTSYKLFGNVRDREDDSPVTKERVYHMLQTFFAERVHTCPPVADAADTLRQLAKDFEIVILTNTPFAAGDARRQSMRAHGMDYPLITNEGHKGAPVAKLAKMTTGPVVFLDDIPHHHTSISEKAPDVHRIHFVADERLAKLQPPAEHSHARLDNWRDAGLYIQRLLQ